MSTAVSLKRALFAGGGVPPEISSRSPLHDSPEAMPGRMSPPRDRDSSCSSSIGRNSDCSPAGSGGEESGEAEVQSALKGPLDTMDLLELGLPISSDINFYRSKSKSLPSLQGGASPWSPPADLKAATLVVCTSSNRKRKKQQPPPFFRGNRDSSSTPTKAPLPSHDRLLKRLADVNQSMPTLGAAAAPTASAQTSSSGSNISATSFEDDDVDDEDDDDAKAVSRSWLPRRLLAGRRRRTSGGCLHG